MRKYGKDLDPGSFQILELYTRANKPAEKVNRSLESLLPAKPVTEEASPKSQGVQKENTKPAWKWDAEKVIKMARDMTEREISAKLGIKRGSVATILLRAGVKAVSYSDRLIERDRFLLAPLAAKMTMDQIAKRLGKPYGSIRVRLIRCGIRAVPGQKGKPMKRRIARKEES